MKPCLTSPSVPLLYVPNTCNNFYYVPFLTNSVFGKIFSDKTKDIGWEATLAPPVSQRSFFFLCCLHAIPFCHCRMGLVCITSWYPNCTGSHFGLPQLYPQNDWTRWQNGVNETHAHGPHCDKQTRLTSEKVCLRFGQCRSLH